MDIGTCSPLFPIKQTIQFKGIYIAWKWSRQDILKCCAHIIIFLYLCLFGIKVRCVAVKDYIFVIEIIESKIFIRIVDINYNYLSNITII